MPTIHSLPSLRPLKSRNVQIVAGLTALLYFNLEVYLFNRELINQTLSSGFSGGYKITLLFQLITGYLSMFPLSQVLFILLTTILVGLNTALMVALIQIMKQAGTMKFSVGGVGVLALVSTGCPSCGLTVLSFLGPTSGFFASALHTPAAQIAMILLLSASVLYSLSKLDKSTVCVIRG